MSDSKLLGLARMLVNMGADGVQGEGLRGQGCVLMLHALAQFSRSPHKPDNGRWKRRCSGKADSLGTRCLVSSRSDDDLQGPQRVQALLSRPTGGSRGLSAILALPFTALLRFGVFVSILW